MKIGSNRENARLASLPVSPGVLFAGVCGGAVAALLTMVAQPRHGNAQGISCAISGAPVMRKNIPIYGRATGEEKVARFTGANSDMVAYNFPTQAGGRVEVKTGTGKGSFKIHGFVDPLRVPIYAAQQVSIVPNHVWLNKGTEVKFEKVVGGRLKVNKELTFPIAQTFSAWGDCNAFALEPSKHTPWLVPDSANPVRVKKGEITLYDAPGGAEAKVVLTLKRASWGEGLVVFRTQRKGGYAQIRYDGEIGVNAWVREGDLHWFPQGELQDVYSPSTKTGHSRIRPAGKPKEITTGSRDIPIHAAPRGRSQQIGVIERETRTLVVDVVGQWASVLPQSFNVAPAGEDQFWVRMKDLGITKKDLADARPPRSE